MVIKFLESLLYPPAFTFLIVLIGALLLVRDHKYGKLILVAGVAITYITSIPATSVPLYKSLESVYPPLLQLPNDGEAIVILSGGKKRYSPEYEGETISRFSLERARYTAYLYRKLKLPIVVAGGSKEEHGIPEAELIEKVLENEFFVPVRWVEVRSRNTWESAQYVTRMLKPHGIKKIVLVTEAYHMRRAAWCFETTGVNVIPAPTGFNVNKKYKYTPSWYVPNVKSNRMIITVMHENIGLIWYKIRVHLLKIT